jgi:heme-dependent oxidative N-demethylase alpha subunit-like protein
MESIEDEAQAVTRPAPASPLSLVDGSPWRLSMGLHRLEEREWLEIDDRRGTELQEKARLLSAARETVLVTLPSGDAASRELFDLVVEHLVAHHDVLDTSGATIVERTTGDAVDVAQLHAIEAASRLVQEDLCVLVRDDAWRLVAACVCFPSRWSLREKLGASLVEIHEPVPGFDETLATPASTFFDRLSAERPVWRRNWTLLDTPALHLPSPAERRRAPDRLGGDLGARLWFRVERQTLRRLPSSDAIAFTIRTTVQPLGDVVAATPGFAHALRSTLLTVPADVAAYKGWAALLAPLVGWLDDAAVER